MNLVAFWCGALPSQEKSGKSHLITSERGMMSNYAVVIPTYNRADCLPRAVRSAQLQSLAPSEIIVVDDGSTDNTHEVMSQIAIEDRRVRFLKSSSRRGACYARNYGVESTGCNYIAFLDSDDVWEPSKIERQISSLDACPAASGSGTWYTKIRNDGKLLKIKSNPVISMNDILYYNVFGPTSLIVTSKEKFQKAGGFKEDMPSCQDWDLISRLLEIGPLIVEQDFLTNQYVDSKERISENNERVIRGHRIMLEKMRISAVIDEVAQADWSKKRSAALIDVMLRKGEFKAALYETYQSPSLRAGARWIRASMRFGKRAYF